MNSAARKLETAITQNYLLSETYRPESLTGVQTLNTRDTATKTLPRIHVLATEVQIASGFEGTGAGEYEGQLMVIAAVSADWQASKADQLTADLEALLNDRCAMIESVNKPATGPDNRPIKGVYLYDANMAGGETTVEERTLYHEFTLSCQFRNDDGDGSNIE